MGLLVHSPSAGIQLAKRELFTSGGAKAAMACVSHGREIMIQSLCTIMIERH